MKLFLPLALVVALAGCDAVTADAPALAAADAPMASASEDAATVINSGRDDATCSLNASANQPFSGTGSATFVTNSGGNTLFRCAGPLGEASPTPDRATRFEGAGPNGTTCDIVVTPGGRFSAVCN